MLEKITTTAAIAFSILWTVILFTEYWFYNPNYGQAINYFQYSKLLGVLILLGAAVSLGLAFARKKKWKIRVFSGWSMFGCLLLLDVINLSFVSSKISSIHLTTQGWMAHLGQFVGVAFCIYAIFLVARVLGGVLMVLFPPQLKATDLPIIQTGAGIMGITLLTFILGLFNLLYFFTLGPIFLAILALNWRSTWQTIKITLLQPIYISPKFNALGVFSFLFLSFFLVSNFVQILRPVPLGTDSINLYVNLPTLIAEYNGLVGGFQIHNWSLLMSLGLVVFGRVDVVLGLSFLGALLSLAALYRLGRRWLDVNQALLCLLLFFSVPMVNFFTFMDMKIDLALLYFLLCTLLLLANWIAPPEKVSKQPQPVGGKTKTRQNSTTAPAVVPAPQYLLRIKTFIGKYTPSVFRRHKMPVLIGVFIGFAMGIKLTALLAFLALLTAIWYKEGGAWLFFSAVCLIIGTALVMQLDGQAFLRQYHAYASIIQWILIITGLGLAAYSYVNMQQKLFRAIKLSAITTLFFVLPILPWLGKNWYDTKSFSSYALLNGKKAMPEINLNTLEKKWKETYE